MILSPISLLDCLVFVIYLVPQLLTSPHVGFFKITAWFLRALPFFVLRLPSEFIQERFFLPYERRTKFVQTATPFQDFIIRIVRYAFANLPSDIGRVFFSRPVAVPFYRFRLWRHGYSFKDVFWEDVVQNDIRGVWMKTLPDEKPDICIYYLHGGGFTMGSPYFYMEFLKSWMTKLKAMGYQNPCVFGLDYTLVPDLQFPAQLHETVRGYKVVLDLAQDAEIVVSGDSAGGNLVLSLLLNLVRPLDRRGEDMKLRKPSFATLISPWPTLVSAENRNTNCDFIDADQLHKYGRLYAGTAELNDAYRSPGICKDIDWWKEAMPTNGMHFIFGAEEVLASEIRTLISELKRSEVGKIAVTDASTVHAWPVVFLFLGSTMKQREEGLIDMSKTILQLS